MKEKPGTGSQRTIELYLQHGWGFDASCWQSWTEDDRQRLSCTVADRGYSGKPNLISSYRHPGAIHVAVTHSFGLHIIPEKILAASDLVVILNSFRQFDPRAARSLRKMAARLLEDPNGVLGDFYKNCFGDEPAPPLPANPNVELICQDLKLLSEGVLKIDPLVGIPQILILHGAQDTVVRVEQAHTLAEFFPNSKLLIHPDASHALPFTHRQWCLQQILETVEPVQLNLVAAGLKA